MAEVLLVLVIVLPPLLLAVGVGFGIAAARWWWARQEQRGEAGRRAPSDEEAAAASAVATAMPSTTSTAVLPPGRKDSCTKRLPAGIHIVASSASLQPPSRSPPSSEACLPLGLRLAAFPPSPLRGAGRRQPRRPAALQMPEAGAQPDSPAAAVAQQLRSLVGLVGAGSACGSGTVTPGGAAAATGGGGVGPSSLAGGAGDAAHRKTGSMDLGQLVRADPSVISQVMDDWDTRSTLYRIMSLDTFNLPSPQQQQAAAAAAAAAAGLLSPAAAALFSPAGAAPGTGSGGGGGAPLAGIPSGEVHMDEIDLMECIGKGGYGCVYKASWRGAGVAVKYIVCPTDDSDSLGRAIREVVLSKKMSHPNVVQCYSWTVLSEPDTNCRSVTPSSRSGMSSPLEQSFTSRRRQQLTGRSSLELLRPSNASLAGPSGGVRRGLDLRFNAVAANAGVGGGGMSHATSSLTLHRITERPTQEGRTLQQEVEAAVGLPRVSATSDSSSNSSSNNNNNSSTSEAAEAAALPLAEHEGAAGVCPVAPAGLPLAGSPHTWPAALGPQPTGEVVEELVAEAAAEHRQQVAAAGDSLQQQSPDVPASAAAAFASTKQLKLQLPLPPSSRSPSSSPGIQAVHAHDAASSSGTPGVAAALAAEVGGPSTAPSPDHYRVDACSVEPASLPQSPFAAEAVQGSPLFRNGGGGSAAQWRLQSAEATRAGSMAQPAQVQAATEHAGKQVDEEEQAPQGVYAHFGSFEEMVAQFQQLAAECEQQDQEEEEEGPAEGEQAFAAADADELSQSRNDGIDQFTVTAASSFSDVLSMSGFMLEGTASGAELTALSLPSSPRFSSGQQQQQQFLRSGQSSCFQPSVRTSATNSHAGTPRSIAAAPAALGSLSRLARAASAAPQACTVQPGANLQLAASMPQPAWPVQAAAAGLAPAGMRGDIACPSGAEGQTAPPACEAAPATCSLLRQTTTGDMQEQQEQHQDEQRVGQRSTSSQDQPPLKCSSEHAQHAGKSAARHSSTVSLSVWQPAPAVEAAAREGGQAEAEGAGQQQQQASKSVLEAAKPAHSPAVQCPPLAGSKSTKEPLPAGVRLPQGGNGAATDSVTPRLCSLSNLGAGAGTSPVPDALLQVTPRQQSLRGCGPLQLSPRADSIRSVGRASGRRRVEELREEAAAAFSGDGLASCDRLSLGSHNDSFNSEEGFGSPVKQRCGGVKDVFQLEELQLSGQEALMVVVMEYCDLGSLRKALKRNAFRPSAKWPFQTTYRALLRTAQEVAKGMGYIHEFNIVHGDLKPGNVLLKTHKVDRRGYIAKVSDFGLSRPLDCDDTHATLGSALGTIAYTSPETFAHNCVKKPSDVYAFGIMLWEMFYCRDPYEGLLDGQICVGVTDGSLRPEFEDDCPEPYRRLAERCWHQDPEMRPSFEEVDRELVRIEMEFRLHRHRANSKRASSGAASAGGGSMPSSRPGSPGVQPRGGGAGGTPHRQFQASALAG